MTLLDAALEYATQGWSVFPCRGKFPAISKMNGGHGFQDATTDPSQIRLWWSEAFYPNANIGIATGESNLVVLDVDVAKPGCREAMKALVEQIPELREGWIAQTGSGGYHYIFAARDDRPISVSGGKLGIGLDIRAKGGYIIAAPSVHPSGPQYVWKKRGSTPPPYVPIGLCEILGTIDSERRANSISIEGDITDNRNITLFSLARSHRMRGLSELEISAAIHATNQLRCKPPLDDDEVNAIVQSASSQKYEAGDLLAYSKAKFGITSPEANVDAGKKKTVLRAANTIVERRLNWLWPGYLAFGKFALMWGMEGRGKSYLTTGLAAQITQGQPLPGVSPLEASSLGPGSVAILAYEDDPEDTIVPRLRMCGADLSKVHIMHYDDNTVSSNDVDSLALTLAEIPDLRLLILDPISSYAAGISDNDETAIRTVIDPLIRLAMGKNYAVVGVKHANKRSDVSVSDRTAGGRAWTAGARSALLVGHDNQKEQTKYHTFGGVLPTKGNLAGIYDPIAYEVDNGVFRFLGPDPSLTPERLFPKPPEKKKA